MLRINKNTLINDSKIECICEYGFKPLIRYVKENDKSGKVRKIKGSYGYNSLIIMEDGYVFLCPNKPSVYLKRQDPELYITLSPKRHVLKKAMIREITTKPNAGQHRDIMKAKAEGKFFDLSGNKKTFYYIFTVNDHIYGLNSLWDMKIISKGDDKYEI